jgi:hypothetical protein
MPNIQLQHKTHSGTVILEVNPEKAVVFFLEAGRCVAVIDLIDVWDLLVNGMLAISNTSKASLIRRTKEAQAVLKWRNDNL